MKRGCLLIRQPLWFLGGVEPRRVDAATKIVETFTGESPITAGARPCILCPL